MMRTDQNLIFIIASFNRPRMTGACIAQVMTEIDRNPSMRASVILIDASTNEETKKNCLPIERLIFRSVAPNRYWSQCMRLGMQMAIEHSPDYIVWLNDDCLLDEGFLARALTEATETPQTILVGRFQDSKSSEATYGGLKRRSKRHPLNFSLREKHEYNDLCDTMNGNLVFIPRIAYERIGVIPRVYRHSLGDYDYGLRARGKGIQIKEISGDFVGRCDRNLREQTWVDESLSTRERIALMTNPKGLPILPWVYFCLRWGGLLGVGIAVKPYFEVLVQHLGPCRAPAGYEADSIQRRSS
jgi:GT2 family glycosyltransferase